MASRRTQILKLTALTLLLWGSLSAAFYAGWIRGADHRDLYPWWAAARLRIFEGRDVYDPATVREMQVMLYGAPRPAWMDQQAFHYPAQMLVLLYPLWWIADKEIAAAIWAGASALLLFTSLWLLQKIRGNPLPAWMLLGLIFWQYPVLMLFQVQATALPLFALAAGYWAFQRGRDVLSGAVLALALVKPELCLVAWVVLLALAARARRWKLIGAFLGMHTLLFVLSVLLAGWWLPGWLGAINRYSGYAASVWIPRAAWQIHPLLAALLLALIAACLQRTRWTATSVFAASIPTSVLLLPQTLVWNLTVLLIPLTLAWHAKARWLVAGIWLAGWAMMFLPAQLWYLQTMLLPVASLAAIALASRHFLQHE